MLFDIDGYSLTEVAAMQQASLSAVKTRLARGRARLRKYYERRTERSSTGVTGSAVHGSESMASATQPDTSRLQQRRGRIESAHATR